jgi:deoxyribodipyrimidine photo-lyase
VFGVLVVHNEILHGFAGNDRRVEFIDAWVSELDAALRELEGELIVSHAMTSGEIPRLAADLGIDAAFANHDYEPRAIDRDAKVAQAQDASGRSWLSFEHHAIFETDEVLSQADTPFSIFTPHSMPGSGTPPAMTSIWSPTL